MCRFDKYIVPSSWHRLSFSWSLFLYHWNFFVFYFYLISLLNLSFQHHSCFCLEHPSWLWIWGSRPRFNSHRWLRVVGLALERWLGRQNERQITDLPQHTQTATDSRSACDLLPALCCTLDPWLLLQLSCQSPPLAVNSCQLIIVSFLYNCFILYTPKYKHSVWGSCKEKRKHQLEHVVFLQSYIYTGTLSISKGCKQVGGVPASAWVSATLSVITFRLLSSTYYWSYPPTYTT